MFAALNMWESWLYDELHALCAKIQYAKYCQNDSDGQRKIRSCRVLAASTRYLSDRAQLSLRVCHPMSSNKVKLVLDLIQHGLKITANLIHNLLLSEFIPHLLVLQSQLFLDLLLLLI